jgi:hypothetical protein
VVRAVQVGSSLNRFEQDKQNERPNKRPSKAPGDKYTKIIWHLTRNVCALSLQRPSLEVLRSRSVFPLAILAAVICPPRVSTDSERCGWKFLFTNLQRVEIILPEQCSAPLALGVDAGWQPQESSWLKQKVQIKLDHLHFPGK